MIILLHSSKTMRSSDPVPSSLRTPELLDKATTLARYLKTLSAPQLARHMHLSAALAAKTHALIADWSPASQKQSVALDSFVGDIYSGLRADSLSPDDRAYADETLRILSGLYGSIRPLDGICPYRLEMGYVLPDPTYKNLYTFWGTAIAEALPDAGVIVNVSSLEYTKAVLPYVDPARVVTPKFMTIDPKTGRPVFVVVHAKIARGAFARWLIVTRATDTTDLTAFHDIGYAYDPALSSPAEPVFVCREFGGKGLSMRLQ